MALGTASSTCSSWPFSAASTPPRLAAAYCSYVHVLTTLWYRVTARLANNPSVMVPCTCSVARLCQRGCMTKRCVWHMPRGQTRTLKPDLRHRDSTVYRTVHPSRCAISGR